MLRNSEAVRIEINPMDRMKCNLTKGKGVWSKLIEKRKKRKKEEKKMPNSTCIEWCNIYR